MHSSAEAAVESLMVADPERCFPDFRKQTKFRQCLNKRKRILSKVEKMFERENSVKIELLGSICKKKMTLHKKLDCLPPPNVGTMWVRGPRVRTI